MSKKAPTGAFVPVGAIFVYLGKRVFFLCILFFSAGLHATEIKQLIAQGWDQLVKDNDTEAIKLFHEAYVLAEKEQNTSLMAESLLKLGIASYGTSLSNGLNYAASALEQFKKLENTQPQVAYQGRCKCLQLISTIKGRQGKYREAIALSRQALSGFPKSKDTTGYAGIIYSALGSLYKQLGIKDSAEYFHRIALKERQINLDYTYLPVSYLNVAEIEMGNNNKLQSKIYCDTAFKIASEQGNRQAMVSALIMLGKWFQKFENQRKAEEYFLQAKQVSEGLSDKTFYLKVLEQLKKIKKEQGKYQEALGLEEQIRTLKDSLANWEKDKIVKSLEVQFGVAEKDRQLSLIQKEKNIAKLTNYILWLGLAFIILLAATAIFFLRRNNKRDKLLLQTKEALVKITEEQKKLKEQQMQNEIEFKESQLSALTLQMLQKNELMQELDNQLKEIKDSNIEKSIRKILTKGAIQDRDWNDFNVSFESTNKNFYAKLKQAYPDISPNDLKICALIKMNLSIKEMAGILNISPDSVKTARYRLRKKLQLNTEDNLTDFILSLK